MNAAWPLILLPCLAGLACLAFRRRRAFCAVFSVASLGAEGALAALLFARGAAPWGWNGVPLLAADGLSRLVCLGIAFFGLMAGVYSLGWFSPRERGGAYWCLLLLTEAEGMGVALADMGGGTTDVAVFKNGTLAYLGVVPLGGNSVTSDLQALRIPWAQAEKLKTDWAVASSSLVDPNQSTKVMRLGGRGTFSVSHAVVSQVAGQRVEEILEAVALEISRSGIDAVDLPGGLILTGGGSRLRGIAELAGRITGLPTETGVPTGFETSTELVLAPEFSTAAGLVLLGRGRREAAGGRRAGFLGELTKWISGIAGRLR